MSTNKIVIIIIITLPVVPRWLVITMTSINMMMTVNWMSFLVKILYLYNVVVPCDYKLLPASKHDDL